LSGQDPSLESQLSEAKARARKWYAEKGLLNSKERFEAEQDRLLRWVDHQWRRCRTNQRNYRLTHPENKEREKSRRKTEAYKGGSPQSHQTVQAPAQEWLTSSPTEGTCVFSVEEERKDGFGFDRNETDETCYLNVEMRRLDE
jgi:hypothetical protein